MTTESVVSLLASGALKERCGEATAIKCGNCGTRWPAAEWSHNGNSCPAGCDDENAPTYLCVRCSGRLETISLGAEHPCFSVQRYQESGVVAFEAEARVAREASERLAARERAESEAEERRRAAAERELAEAERRREEAESGAREAERRREEAERQAQDAERRREAAERAAAESRIPPPSAEKSKSGMGKVAVAIGIVGALSLYGYRTFVRPDANNAGMPPPSTQSAAGQHTRPATDSSRPSLNGQQKEVLKQVGDCTDASYELSENDDPHRAIELCRKAVSMTKSGNSPAEDVALAQALLVRALLSADRSDLEARRNLLEIVKLCHDAEGNKESPGCAKVEAWIFPEAMLTLAQSYRATGDFAASLDLSEKALRLDRSKKMDSNFRENALLAKAFSELFLQKYSESLASFERLANQDSQSKISQIDLALFRLLATMLRKPPFNQAEEIGSFLGRFSDAEIRNAIYNDKYKLHRNLELYTRLKKSVDWYLSTRSSTASTPFKPDGLDLGSFVSKSEAIALVRQLSLAGLKGDEAEMSPLMMRLGAIAKPQRGNRKDARKLLDKGLALFRLEDFKNSADVLGWANLLDPLDIQIANDYGFALLKSGQFDAAEQALSNALVIVPTRSAAWFNLGELYAKMQDQDRSVGAYVNAWRTSANRAKTIEVLSDQASSDQSEIMRSVATEALRVISNQS